MDRPTTAATQTVIHVLATTYEATRAALTTAIPLAKGAHARLVVVVTKIVPYALALDEPVDATDFALRRLLPRRSTVVVGGPARLDYETNRER